MPGFLVSFLFMVASSILQAILVKPPAQPVAGSLKDFDFPQIDEGTPEAVFFGDCWTDGWMILWFGNLRTTKIRKGGKK